MREQTFFVITKLEPGGQILLAGTSLRVKGAIGRTDCECGQDRQGQAYPLFVHHTIAPAAAAGGGAKESGSVEGGRGNYIDIQSVLEAVLRMRKRV